MDTPRERGPAEELVAKRLRPLNKKIQRFRNYSTSDPESLNADQRAGLASLPALEAVARELEEVQKAMEEVELVAAARAREVREAAEREYEERVAGRLRAHALSTARDVQRFLALHTLLHPARPSDTANLTFAPLTLPLRMQDEVLATDILRVARMYEDLVAGGDSAHGVLTVLATGPAGVDDEDDRVHHLITLLETPPSADDAGAIETESTAAEPALSMRDDASAVSAGTLSDDDDPQRTPVMQARAMPRGAALNFLQEDELELDASPAPAVVVDVDVVVHEYEVIEPMSAVMSEAAETVPSTPQTPQTPQTPADWSEAVDEPEPEVAAPDVTPKREAREAREVREVQKDDSKKEDGKKDKSQKKDGGEGRKRRPQQRREPKDKKKDDAPAHAQAAAGPGGKVDDDGFEVKTSRRASNAGARGRGAPRGRGRGGAPREGRANGKENGNSGSGTPRKPNAGANGNANASKAKDKDAKADAPPKPKPSIYKTAQPTGPASAPIF